MARPERTVVDYCPGGDEKLSRRTLIWLAALMLACVSGYLLFRWTRTAWWLSPNAAINYPHRVGAIPSLYEIRNAIVAWSVRNGGALPRTMEEMVPSVSTPAGWTYRVTPPELAPYVVIIPISRDAVPLPVGPGRFILVVHLRGKFPMDSCVTLAVGETGTGYKEQYSDQDITAALGSAQLQELKNSSFPTP